jgi:hypothetical protein
LLKSRLDDIDEFIESLRRLVKGVAARTPATTTAVSSR